MPIVPVTRIVPTSNAVQNGAPVRGEDWVAAGGTSNWIAGTGRQLVPAFTPDQGIYTWAGTVGGLGNNAYPWRFRFRLRPSINAIERIWVIKSESGEPIGYSVDGTSLGVRGSSYEAYSQRLTTQSSADDDVILEISPTRDLRVDCIACWELPRAIIDDDATELGTIQERLRSSQPIQGVGIQRMLSTATDEDLGKRTLFHWATAYSEGGSAATSYARSTSSSTFSDLFATDFPVLGRKVFTGDTVRRIGARVYGWVSSGGSGEIRLKSSVNGQMSTTATLTNVYIGGGIWSAEMTGQDIDAEDTGAVDGRQGAAWDMFNFEFRATVGTLYISSATIYEV